LGAGCENAVQPTAESLQLGLYRLGSVDGLPLPSPLQVTSECSIQVDAGYLWFRDSVTFQLQYQGVTTCQPGPGSGATWEAFYAGDLVLTADSAIFRMPDLSHLGLDSLRFVGHRLPDHQVEAVVPQIPDATGPPATLRFAFDSTMPPPTLRRGGRSNQRLQLTNRRATIPSVH
jgi:hypothetical protein